MPHSVSSSSALGVGAVGCKTKTSQHHAQGMQMTLEAVPVQAVLLQRPHHLGPRPVLPWAGCGYELLLQAIAAHQRGVVATGGSPKPGRASHPCRPIRRTGQSPRAIRLRRCQWRLELDDLKNQRGPAPGGPALDLFFHHLAEGRLLLGKRGT